MYVSTNPRIDPKLGEFFRGTSVAITGAAGSIGKELVRQLLQMDVRCVIALDNDENGLFLLGSDYGHDKRLVARFCDIAIAPRLKGVFDGVDYVFHAAALKHVPICEDNPMAAVDTNLVGLLNVMEAALLARVRKVLFTSSDKAVNPTNVMGASKLMGERVATSMNMRNGFTRISCTRFGNVAGSRGSVIPLFLGQIAAGTSITLTAPEMTRFFMSIEEAVSLVIESLHHTDGGETFVTKMATIKIGDLAHTLIRLYRGSGYDDIKIVGPRPGEKLYEELTTEEELSRTFEFEHYLLVAPVQKRYLLGEEIQHDHLGVGVRAQTAYNSRYEKLLSDSEIETFLRKCGLLPESLAKAPAKELA